MNEVILSGIIGAGGAVLGAIVSGFITYKLTKNLEVNQETSKRIISLNKIKINLICFMREKILELEKLGLKQFECSLIFTSLERKSSYFKDFDKDMLLNRLLKINDMEGMSENDILKLSELHNHIYKFIFNTGTLVTKYNSNKYSSSVSVKEYDEQDYFFDATNLFYAVSDYVKYIEGENKSEDFVWIEKQKYLLNNY
ncbi:hypothetical protein GA053_26195 [Bacteroides thetaiotaomicron]|nr:hypothetical protein GA053_26195 [Bacteroides thetaiotaomicron]